jgi:cardiolipin synthase A/B
MSRFPLRNSNITIFTNGTDLFKQMVKDMKDARHHIHLLFYIFRDDPFGSLVLELLENKVKEGVEVRLLFDWLGSWQFSRRRIKELRKKGIEVSFCHKPRFPFFFYTLQNRNHRKIIVIDGKIGYLGGFNIGKEYVNRDEVLNPWKDCHVRYTGREYKIYKPSF